MWGRGVRPGPARGHCAGGAPVDWNAAWWPSNLSSQWIPSAKGPSANAGRKVKAHSTTVTAATRPTNCGRCVGSVPGDSGVRPCRASEPASANTRIIGRNLAKTIANPSAVLYHVVFTDRPAKAEPLLFDAELNA